jgi:hypothetical protein
MRMTLVIMLTALTLTGCAGSLKPQTPAFVPPASCIEHAQDVPAPKVDMFEYAADLIVQYTDLAVLREQCRSALVKEQK